MPNQPEPLSEEAYLSLEKEYRKLAETNFELQQKNAFLEHELAQLKRTIFGAKKERFIPSDSAQMALELEAVESLEEEPEKELITYRREKTKKKGKAVRLELPAHLPRQTEVIEPEKLREDAKKIGEAITEILEYNPGKLFVKKYVRPKYVQQEKIVIGPLPTLPIPQGNAGPGLLTHLLISKFTDHLPFYRQMQQFKREGVKLAESTISGWFTKTCQLLEPLYDCLRSKVQQADYINGDETPIPVQSSHKPGATHKGYHWVYRAPLVNLVCFDYQKSRGREGPEQFLQNFSGALQTDGYAGYEIFDTAPNINLLACMAHARRYFEHALDNDAERATYVLSKMQELYAIERQAKKESLSHEQRYRLRGERAIPVLKELEEWLKTNISEVLPKSAIGKAIAYSLKLWPRLKRYTENGKWAIDNNMVENSIRPVALGRKNYLFAGSYEAAQNAAMMYSFLETCKMNGIEPFEWLKQTITKIPDCKVSELERLLPISKD